MAVVSATVSVVCSVLSAPTAPTRRMSKNSAPERRVSFRRRRLWRENRYAASTTAVSALVRTTATPAPAMPSAGIGPMPRHPNAHCERRHEHVAGAADHAREGVREPHEPGAGEHHVRVGERRLERAALPAERRVELPAEGDHRDREQKTETAVDEDRVEHERVGIVAASGPERPGDRR